MGHASLPHSVSYDDLAAGTWRLDPASSLVQFRVPNFWGLLAVTGRFRQFEGVLDLSAEPAIVLDIDATSLDTKMRVRDRHLRAADFFDTQNHPRVRFASDSVVADGGGSLKVRGRIHASGHSVPLSPVITVQAADGYLEVQATAHVDHRQLGMIWSPLGIVRTPTKLAARGRLIRSA